MQRAFFVLALLIACGDPATRTFPITTHALSGECTIPASARGSAQLELWPRGDYPSVTEALRLPLTGSAPLSVPEATRALEARLSVGDESFIGYSERTAGPALPILLWPEKRACRLSSGEREYPGRGGGQGLGYDPVSRRVLLAGGDDPMQMGKSAELLGFDAGTGAVVEGKSLRDARVFATVTSFGGRLLVAGGEDPFNSQGSVVVPSDTAEVVDLGAESAVLDTPKLRVPRTRHTATVLPNGDTLLVGGRGPFGDALNLLEAVSPRGAGTSITDFPSLRAPRFFPTVLPLDDGRLFIGGGTAADESPLSVFEWLSRDGRTRIAVETPEELPARHDRAFAAMPGGGVLVVGGCAPGDRAEDECSACRNGCPPPNGGYDAWWILPDNTRRRLESFEIAAPRPVLLGNSGSPVLAPGAGDALYVFDPWRAVFDPLESADVPCPPRAGLPVIGLGDQAFVWVSDCELDQPALVGMRIDTRGRYTSDVDWVPDRPPGDLAQDTPDGLRFAVGSDVVVYAAGSDYANFTLTLELEAESAVPRLVFTSPDRVGPIVLSLPQTDARALQIERRANVLRVASESYDVPAGRLHVGLAGGDGETAFAVTLERDP